MKTRRAARAAAVVITEAPAADESESDNSSISSGNSRQLSRNRLPYGARFPEIVPKQLHDWAKLVTNFLRGHNITSSVDKYRMLTSHLPSQLQLDVAGFLDRETKKDPFEEAIKLLAIHYRTDVRINYDKGIKEIKRAF